MLKSGSVAGVMTLLASFVATPCGAATSIVNDSGLLIGALNVDVNGTRYDVEFVDGTCTSLFSGCDELVDFDFTTLEQANAAAQALLDQVFIGVFDEPQFTFGCGFDRQCRSAIPYGFLDADGTPFDGEPLVTASINQSGINPDVVFEGFTERASDFSTRTDLNFARFSISSAVPEPDIWAMLLLGFGAAGLAIRRANGAERPNRLMRV